MGDAIVIIGVLVVAAVISMRRRGAASPAQWSRQKADGAGGKQQVRQRLEFARLAVRILLALTVIFVIVPLIIWILT